MEVLSPCVCQTTILHMKEGHKNIIFLIIIPSRLSTPFLNQKSVVSLCQERAQVRIKVMIIKTVLIKLKENKFLSFFFPRFIRQYQTLCRKVVYEMNTEFKT